MKLAHGLTIKSSAIHGRGCFATIPFKRRHKIAEYTGDRLHGAVFHADKEQRLGETSLLKAEVVKHFTETTEGDAAVPTAKEVAGVFDSMVLVVDADLRGPRPALAYRVVPLSIGDQHLPRCVSGHEGEEAIRRVQALSSMVADKRAHRRLWLRRCKSEAVSRMRIIFYAFVRGHFARGGRALWTVLSCREDRRWIIGLVSLGYL